MRSDCETSNETRDIRYILSVLPHRFPFLLVDRIVELNPGVSARGYKLISCNEPWLQCPGLLSIPPAYIIEALAQLSGCIVLEPREVPRQPPYFAGIDRARFRGLVLPGDRLELDAWIAAQRRSITKVEGRAKVDGRVVCSALLSFAAPS